MCHYFLHSPHTGTQCAVCGCVPLIMSFSLTSHARSLLYEHIHRQNCLEDYAWCQSCCTETGEYWQLKIARHVSGDSVCIVNSGALPILLFQNCSVDQQRCCGAHEATSRVDCLTSLHLWMDPLLLSAVNLQHCESSHVTKHPNCYTQLVALRCRHPDCSQLPWSSISPLIPDLHYCCCCFWDSWS